MDADTMGFGLASSIGFAVPYMNPFKSLLARALETVYAFEEAIEIINGYVPPTAQNQKSIESDLRQLASRLAKLPLNQATLLAEHAVRNYDPCISCSTHFLRLNIEREDEA